MTPQTPAERVADLEARVKMIESFLPQFAEHIRKANSFFDKHPIINPISKNPIRIDIQKGGGAPIRTKVHNGKTYFEMAPGQWHE